MDDIDVEKASVATIIIYSIIGCIVILAIIILVFKFGFENKSAIVPIVKGVSGISFSSIDWSKLTNILFPVFLVIIIVYFFVMGSMHNMTHNSVRSTQESVNSLVAMRRGVLSNSIDPLVKVERSVCSELLKNPRTVPYSLIHKADEGTGDQRSLVNWRPLTVRLTGYLGGPDGSAMDGVFNMDSGVRHALHLGARGFFFDIDYLDATPCEPVVVFRDDEAVMRSLHTGSIKDGMQVLANKAFETNYDPVLITLYLRRVPAGESQKGNFFKNIAAALNPLASNHLGLTDNGNFHNCNSESKVFLSPITMYQKKFIVLVNYDTSFLPRTRNPKDNLHYWTNARIYADPSGPGVALGYVTTTAPTAPAAVAHVGLASQLLKIGSTDKPAYVRSSIITFKIALSSPDYKYNTAELNILLNELGIQCVPLDVLRLGVTAEHRKTLNSTALPRTLAGLSDKTNINDPLSFWTYAGWSWKNLEEFKREAFQDYKEGFQETAPVEPIKPIPGFVIPKPLVPKKPSSKMNSNGGLVNVA
jgi:hypothetical protein